MSARRLFAIPWLIGFTSTVFLLYAGYTAWDSHRLPPVHVITPDLVVDNATVGKNVVEYVVVNEGSEPVHLLGGDARCVAGCCFGPVFQDLPIIMPGSRVAVPYEMHVRAAGEPFAAESTLFLDWRGQMIRLKVTVSGTATGGTAANLAQ